MKQCKLIPILILILMLTALSSTAMAGIGAEVGVGVPLGGTSSSSSDADCFSGFRDGDIELSLSAQEKKSALKLSLQVKNYSTAGYVIEHSTKACYDFAVFDKNGKELYRHSQHQLYESNPLTEEIDPNGGVITYEMEVPKKDYRKITDDAYMVEVHLNDTNYTIRLKLSASTKRPSGIMLGGSISIGTWGGWYRD